MKQTYIQTTEGTIACVEWWQEEDFRGRSISVAGIGVIPVPDDSILCDFCNAEIRGFPVPVLYGTHALCSKCLRNISKKGGDSYVVRDNT